MLRILFEKKGSAIWISHLDLMRLFQRACKRAGLSLKHTQGFNPRPSVSIALPLSVGVESVCELLDFELDGAEFSCDEICSRLNKTLVSGIKVLGVYNNGRKVRDLALLECFVYLEYDFGITDAAVEQIRELFSRDEVIVPKKTKNGVQEQNIIPMIRKLEIHRISNQELRITARVCCQNPALNPAQLASAISIHLPELTPDFSRCSRQEIYDAEEVIFR